MNTVTRRAFCLLPLCLLLAGCGESPEDKASREGREAADNLDNEKLHAYVLSQQFVDHRLKSPGSAKYPDYDSSFVTITSPGNYIVKSYVNSQNGFGALLRSDWTVKMHKDGDGFVSDDVKVEQE